MYADSNHLLHKRLPHCQFVSRFMVTFLTDFYKGVKKFIWCLSVMKTGTLPNFCVVLCIVCFVSFSVLFVCICVLYYCQRVATRLQLNISYHINFDVVLLCTEFMKVCGNSYASPLVTGAKLAESSTWLFTFFWRLVCAEFKVDFTVRCWAWYLIAWAVLFFAL
jgi:hypothetical protein